MSCMHVVEAINHTKLETLVYIHMYLCQYFMNFSCIRSSIEVLFHNQSSVSLRVPTSNEETRPGNSAHGKHPIILYHPK